jgi:hypothetical protein
MKYGYAFRAAQEEDISIVTAGNITLRYFRALCFFVVFFLDYSEDGSSKLPITFIPISFSCPEDGSSKVPNN